MKKLVGILAVIILLFVGGLVTLATVDINRLWKDNLYVQINEPAEVEETRLDSGQIVKRYWYESPAFDEDGESTLVRFSAARELRADGYLMLYVKSGDQVTSYDEVQWEEIPVQAQEQLGE